MFRGLLRKETTIAAYILVDGVDDADDFETRDLSALLKGVKEHTRDKLDWLDCGSYSSKA